MALNVVGCYRQSIHSNFHRPPLAVCGSTKARFEFGRKESPALLAEIPALAEANLGADGHTLRLLVCGAERKRWAFDAARIRGTESAKVHPDYNVVDKTIYSVTNPTLDQMQTLGLVGMAAAWGSWLSSNGTELSREEWLGLMLDREIAMRRQPHQDLAPLSQAALPKPAWRTSSSRAVRPRPAQYHGLA